MINPHFFSLLITLLIFIVLIAASIFSNNNSNHNNIRLLSNSYFSINTMKLLSFLALINLILFSISPTPSSPHLFNWINFPLSNNFSIFLDINFIFFSSTALIVTWSIIEFTHYYMEMDPFSNNFFRMLLIFLLNMLILTSANNLFLFFIGWEGVGFLSFLLISWWSTRSNANASALQAIIYNRIGDIGILILIVFILSLSNSWNINSLTTFYSTLNENWKNLILLSSLLAAIGKSAQFGLHPWLPAAMEGPTPVSALLHSSTMVVAGVFLLIRISSLIVPTSLFLTSCTIIGALTAIFAATTASTQHDIKKIIAYSTTSQLGLMVMVIGLGQPILALFHICTHAFFKAMLFLCSGSIIHSFNNEQDLRKMNNIYSSLPITSSCLFLGSIALMGIPFLSGFYSKDLILENVANSPTNFLSMILVFLATALTAIYSFRIIALCFLNNNNAPSINPINEENSNLYNPLLRLGLGAIIVGWLLINFILSGPNLFPHPFIKNLPIIVTAIGLLAVYTLTIYNNSSNTPNSFLLNAWFFAASSHAVVLRDSKNLALNLSGRPLDRGWSETIGGSGAALSSWSLTQFQQITQSGYIKQYLLSTIIISTSLFLFSRLI